jgi:hypothetical protein
MANLMVYDMRIAREQKDADRFSRDENAVLDMADQLHGPDQFLVGNIAGMGLDLMAYGSLDATLNQQPALLSDGQLSQIAHRLAGPKTAADLVDLHAERLAAADLIQRIFSNNGHGNGHITAFGMKLLRLTLPLYFATDKFQPNEKAVLAGPVPVVALTMAPRREFLAMYDRILDQEAAELWQPVRSITGPTAYQALSDMSKSDWFLLRYGPLAQMVPSVWPARVVAARLLGRRDGLLVGIALELFRRHHGRYPATLNELPPLLLPTVPVDRITGEPLHYKLVAGKPLVYSVGADRVDDGGTPAMSQGTNTPDSNAAAYFWGGTPPRGDWILYPQSEFNPAN